MIPYEYIIIFLAGWGAGVVTGLIGASAVAVVNPMLVIFLGYNVYHAIGIGLSVDVFSSSASAAIYKRFGNTSKASSLESAAKWAFTTYKGHFKPGSVVDDAVAAVPGGGNTLLIGGALLLGAFLLFRRKGDA